MTISDVCNIALDRIGHTSRVYSYSGDPSSIAKMCRRHYPIAAEIVLTSYEWKDAVSWTTLGPDEYQKSYTGAATGNDAGDADFVVEEAIDAFTPYSGTITIDGDEYDYVGWDTSTFTLKSGQTLSATYDDSDACLITPNNWIHHYERMYAKPSTALEVLELEGDAQNEFRVEGGYVYTNLYDATYGVKAKIIKDIRDEVSSVTVYRGYVGDAIASELAYRLSADPSFNIDQNQRLLLREDAEETLRKAIAKDTRARGSAPKERTRWVDVK